MGLKGGIFRGDNRINYKRRKIQYEEEKDYSKIYTNEINP